MNLAGPQPTLISPLCIIRPFTPDDAPDLAAKAGHREIARTTLRIPHPYCESQARDYIHSTHTAWAEGKGASFAIIERTSAALAGGVGLTFEPAHHHAELGYWIAVDSWGKGLATDAAARIIDWALGELGLSRIHAHAFSSNPASLRVLEKIGMKHEGTLRRHIHKWNQVHDAILYGLLREEWLSQRPA
ncbi:MAG TPA: GNAT family N-acetyltransferase [Phycisphaerales bacterium]|nr:GNAT family N-acetyltransferase [Phycisphaerales bacterium]